MPEEKSSAEEKFERYLPMARGVASASQMRYPMARRDDLLAAAESALWETARRYSSLDLAQFRLLALTRIRGAIVDELRASDWLPRRTRKSYGGHFREIMIDGLPEAERKSVEGEMSMEMEIEEALDAASLSDRLQAAIDRLQWREAIMVRGLLRGEKHRELAERFGISVPRVSQIMSQALAELRVLLR